MLGPMALTNVVETVRIAVAPVFLVTALATLLGVVTGRLARVVNRARELAAQRKDETSAFQRAELHLIPSRIRLINRSILLAAAATLAVCLVIVLLFVSSLIDLHSGIVVALTFIVAMLLLMGALVSFIAEIRIALSLLHVSTEALSED